MQGIERRAGRWSPLEGLSMKNNGTSYKQIEERVFHDVEAGGLLQRGDRVLAGVSGGADSVCLLFVLLSLRERWKGQLHIEAVHVHHMIRGEEADRDMDYVMKLCREYDVRCHVVKKPVLTIAETCGLSTEEAGRKVRYEAFEEVSRRRQLGKIAVAHHQDDNAETILMNLFRGSGLKGVSGIPAMRGPIVRPLLGLSRREIETYLQERAVGYCVDSTNDSCDYTRNKIRNELLPYIENNINTKATEHLVRFAGLAGEIDDYFQKKATILLEKYAVRSENRVILSLSCLEEEPVEVTYLIRRCLEESRLGLKDVSAEHMEQILCVMSGRTGGKCCLPGGMIVEKSYEQCLFYRENIQESERTDGGHSEKNQEPDLFCLNVDELEENQPLTVEISGYTVIFTKKTLEKSETFPKNKYTKWFDCDRIKGTLQIRPRRQGDFLVVNDQGGRKKLKDYFINEKVPREDRDRKVLLTEGQEVLWIFGMRISQRYKVDEKTGTILEVQVGPVDEVV